MFQRGYWYCVITQWVWRQSSSSVAQFAQPKLSLSNKISPSLCYPSGLAPEGRHNLDTSPLSTKRRALLQECYWHSFAKSASFSLLLYLFALPLAPSVLPVTDPQRARSSRNLPRSYFETVSDQLARPLTHFRLITPSLCDTNQLWMKKKPAKMHRNPFMCQTPRPDRRTQSKDEEEKEKDEAGCGG